METFWYFWRWFCQAYDSSYDSDLLFLFGHKCSYDSDRNSIANESQLLKCTLYVKDFNWSRIIVHMFKSWWSVPLQIELLVN